MTPPQPPGPGHPPRSLPCSPAELIGSDAETVRRKLGAPDAREPGRVWSDLKAPPPGTVERNPSGELHAIAVFGPVPQRILPGRPYQVWTYRNVSGLNWLLYFAAEAPDTKPVLVEVAHYPAGAVS